jgi:DNA polymerase delta subunit 1
MVLSGVSTVAEAIELGKIGAVLVTKKFPDPIKLEFEKVYFPWLLMSKKKYAGLFWTKSDKPDKLDAKGIESVRRDNCGIVRHVVDRVLKDIIAIEPNIPKAIDFCKGVISDVLQNKMDLSLLIITKSYSRPAEAYKSPQAHVVLAQRMEKRDPSTAPSVGDRVPYVIVQGEKKDKTFDKAEDPLYVLENDIPIDSKYYIDQLISPLCRIFGPIIENPEVVFTTGEHTRKKFVPTPKATTRKAGGGGGLGSFLVIRESCMGCKAPLLPKEKVLCGACQENSVDIYMRYLENNREKESQFQRLWTHCQSCQGSVFTEVVCAANDCPIFYKRTKAHKDCVESQKSLSKFALSW